MKQALLYALKYGLQSIYPEYISCNKNQDSNVIIFEIPVQLDVSHRIILSSVERKSELDSLPEFLGQSLEHSVSALPPILLHITLPNQYPLGSAPQITSIHATSSWLPRLSVLMGRLLGMWQEGEGVLYAWIEYIESGRFIEDIGLMGEDEIIRYASFSLHIYIGQQGLI